MKKITFLLIAGVLASLVSSAQLHIIRKHGGNVLNDSTVVIRGLSSGLLTDSLYIINTSSSGISVNVRRDIISQVTGSDNYFCWYLTCFSPAVDSSNMTVGGEPPCPISSGDTNKTFYCDYNPSGNSGTSYIRYTFMNSSNRADTSWVTIEYIATISGIQTITEQNINFSPPYPNPSNSSVNFNYNFSTNVHSANLKIFNLLGECVQTIALNTSKNRVTFDVQNVPSGIYVCEIEASGCLPAYQRMVVSH